MKPITIEEAVQLGIDKLTREPWNPMAHLRLHLLKGTPPFKYHVGPWYEIWDIDLEGKLPMKVCQTLLFVNVDGKERAWRPWRHPKSWLKE